MYDDSFLDKASKVWLERMQSSNGNLRTLVMDTLKAKCFGQPRPLKNRSLLNVNQTGSKEGKKEPYEEGETW